MFQLYSLRPVPEPLRNPGLQRDNFSFIITREDGHKEREIPDNWSLVRFALQVPVGTPAHVCGACNKRVNNSPARSLLGFSRT